MATIATLIQKTDGSLEGTLATLNVTAQVATVPNGRKAKDNEPDFRIISRRNGFELGAGWSRISQSTGADYISVSLSAPEFWDHLRQHRQRALRRRDQEGHHLE